MTVFLREYEAMEDEAPGWFEVSDKDAQVIHVSMRQDYNEDGSFKREWICLTVKDRGDVAKAVAAKCYYVVRGLNVLVVLPDGAGKFLGFVQTRRGDQFYVFASTRPLQPIGSTSEGATLLPPVKEAAKSGLPSGDTACPCVHAGPTVHEKGETPSEPKPSEAEPDSWWPFPDTQPASGG